MVLLYISYAVYGHNYWEHFHYFCSYCFYFDLYFAACYLNQVSQLGMSDRVGNISFEVPQSGELVMSKPYSEQTAQIIDEEVRTLIQAAYDSTFKLLTEHKSNIEKVYDRLIY